ncbi:hypothetical protein FJY93_04690 [Candidatus Kaiserbacteria bacterium]|nr:hypothetical protein [Candidatus Kaiserbacteria bacterium]
MPTHIKTILEAAIRAPSGENVQPWHFTVQGTIIDVHIPAEKGASLYGWGERASYVAVGAALENMRIAAAASGWSAQIDLLPDIHARHAARITLVEGSDGYGDGLFSHIAARVTNRKPYDGKLLTPEDIAALRTASSGGHYGSVRFIESRDAIKKIAEVGSGNERIMLGNRLLHSFFFSHVNWTKAEDDARMTGFYIDTLELPAPARIGFKFISTWSRAQWLNRILRFNRVVAAGNAQLYGSASLMGIISAPQESPQSALEIGMLVERLWLTATARGLALQPLTGVLYFMLRLRAGETDGFSEDDRRLIAEYESSIRDTFQLTTDDTPYFMFRIGHAPPVSARSSRFPLERVSTYIS